MGRAALRIRDGLSLRRWTLWSQRPTLLAYCLVVEAITLVATAATAIVMPIHRYDIGILAVLALLGVLQSELGRQVERVRRLVSGTPHINMTSVWTVAGVLLLPPALVGVLVAVLYGHLATRSLYRMRRVPPFRTVLNASLVVLTCYATSFVLAYVGVPTMYAAVDRGWDGAGAVGLAMVAYFVVAAVTILPALTITTRSFKEFFGGLGDNALEVATICLGALTALALATLPALVVAVMPPMLLLHRAVLVRQLEAAATTDARTGLFNVTGWHHLATHELAKAESNGHTLGVLMIDLDHFKRINDMRGHLAGDAVLRAVADTIRAEVRAYDSVGRFGGEEFVVLLPDIPESGARAVAERVRHAITQLEVIVVIDEHATVIGDLSASIGVATYPEAGTALDRILHAADAAMYRAKAGGRNKVVSISDS